MRTHNSAMQAGFSLVEVMVVAAVGAVLALALSSLMGDNMRSVRRVNTLASMSTLEQMLRGYEIGRMSFINATEPASHRTRAGNQLLGRCRDFVQCDLTNFAVAGHLTAGGACDPANAAFNCVANIDLVANPFIGLEPTGALGATYGPFEIDLYSSSANLNTMNGFYNTQAMPCANTSTGIECPFEVNAVALVQCVDDTGASVPRGTQCTFPSGISLGIVHRIINR